MGAGHYILRFYELLCKFAEGLPGYSLVLGRPSPGSLVMYFGIHGMGTAVVLFCIRGRSAFIRAKSPARCNAYLAERDLQTRISSISCKPKMLMCFLGFMPLVLRLWSRVP